MIMLTLLRIQLTTILSNIFKSYSFFYLMEQEEQLILFGK
jgi:hypothetical protein